MIKRFSYSLVAVALAVFCATIFTGCSSVAKTVADSFSNNLLEEERYRMILDGLQVTLLITACAAALGTFSGMI